MGEMQRLTISDIGELYDGPHATPKRRYDGPYFLNISSLKSGRLDLAASDHVSEEDYTTWTRRVTPQGGDLLFSYETRIGEAALMPDGVRACLGRRMALLRPDQSVVVPRFLIYYYLSPGFQKVVEAHTIHGATVNRIGLAAMPKWDISIPGLSEQQKLADVLGALDDKIAVNDRIVSLTEQFLAAAFSRMGVDSSEAPLNSSLGDLVDLNPSAQPPAVPDPVYLEMKNLPDKAMTVTDWGHRAARGGARFQNGDTLLARITPCLENGKVGYVDFLDDGEIGVGSTEFIVLRPRTGIPAVLPYFLASSPRFRDFAVKRMVGTSGRQRLAAADLADYPLHHPEAKELVRFESLSSALMERVKAAVDESRKLATTRDELLPLLMSGKIRVRDAEKVVEEVV